MNKCTTYVILHRDTNETNFTNLQNSSIYEAVDSHVLFKTSGATPA